MLEWFKNLSRKQSKKNISRALDQLIEEVNRVERAGRKPNAAEMESMLKHEKRLTFELAGPLPLKQVREEIIGPALARAGISEMADSVVEGIYSRALKALGEHGGGTVIKYKNDAQHCFCQLKLPSEERILISVSQEGIGLLELDRRGRWPVSTIWQAPPNSTELRKAISLFGDPENPLKHPLDALRDGLITRGSITEIKTMWQTGDDQSES